MTKVKLKDLLFPRYFLLNEIDLSAAVVNDLLEYDLEIMKLGEPDSMVVRGNRVVYSNPSSPMRFLFNLLYNILCPKLADERHRDNLGLALIGMCRDYVYTDYDKGTPSEPPVVVSPEKIDIVQMVLSEIIEPLVGKIKRLPVFFYPCKFTDICRVIETRDQLTKEYNLSYHAVPISDFPIILTNSQVYNNAARMSHILCTTLKQQFSAAESRSILRSILADKESHITKNLIVIIKALRSDPLFTVNFLGYLGSQISEVDRRIAESVQADIVAADNYLSQHIKIADFGNPIGNQQSQVFRQWSQWSMMLGLTEKQLGSMRGSMWPATENLKPFDDRKKQMIADRAEKKGSPLNFEELLEIAREVYNHNAKPGTLIETLLKDNRVWKA